MNLLLRISLLAALLGLGVVAGCQRGTSRTEQAAADKLLLVGNGTEPQSLDPHITTGVQEHHIFMSILEGLVCEHPSEETVEPGVAEKWEPNDRLDEWTFHLRANARWSNGDPLTARDFVYAYRRILMPRLASQYAEMLYLLKGAREFNEAKTDDFSTVGVRAPDDRTLVLSLVGPTPYFPLMLPHYAWFPVHQATIEKYAPIDERRNPWTKPGRFVGNGPFILKEWRFNHFIEVERNPHYWDVAGVKLNRIRFFPITNTASEERMFRDGQLHMTETLPLDKLAAWKKNPAGAYREIPYLATYFYRINTKRGPMKDPRVRKALAFAIDQRGITDGVIRGGQIPATGICPAVAGYTGPRMVAFDPEKARQLLAEAGFPDGRNFPRFDILINVMESHKSIAEAIQQMWKKHLNINVGINAQDWSVYLDSQQRLDYDVCRAAWTADYADPMTFLDMWTAGNGNNETGWENPAFDALIAKAKQTAGDRERFAILREAETLLLDEMPIMPIYYYVRNYLVSPMVVGWHPKLLDNHPWKHFDLKVPADPR